MTPLAYWVHNFSPFVPYLQFTEKFGVRWYGLAYVLGFVGGAWLITRAAKAGRSQLPAEKTWDLIVALVAGVMIGGRLGSFIFYHPEELLHDPLVFFRVWEGGMASHGGFIGLAVAIAWYARSQRLPFLHISDVVVSAGPLGLLFGRIANFINGELWGRVTDGPWGMVFRGAGELPRHPSQLYQFALEGLALFALLWWFSSTPRARGQVSGLFLLGYGVFRFIAEFAREPDAFLGLLALGLSMGQWLCMPMIAGGLWLLVWTRR